MKKQTVSYFEKSLPRKANVRSLIHILVEYCYYENMHFITQNDIFFYTLMISYKNIINSQKEKQPISKPTRFFFLYFCFVYNKQKIFYNKQRVSALQIKKILKDIANKVYINRIEALYIRRIKLELPLCKKTTPAIFFKKSVEFKIYDNLYITLEPNCEYQEVLFELISKNFHTKNTLKYCWHMNLDASDTIRFTFSLGISNFF